MTTSPDWLSRSNEALFNQSALTLNYLDEHFPQFGIDGKTAEWINGDFKVKQRIYADAYLAWQDPAERTKSKIVALRDAKEKLIPAYRELNGFLKNSPNVSNEDLVKMSLSQRSSNKPTPVPVPASYPDLTVEPAGVRQVKLSWRDHNSKGTAKPKGVGGAVLKWAILPAQPASIAELTNSALDTKTPYVFSFDENRRGQMLYVAAAWQNTRGEMGNWSEIVNAIIP
jgi:hypothetical protein